MVNRMTDMPEKIYAWPSDVTPPDETALAGTWGVSRYPPEAEAYTRDDIAWNEALEAAVREADEKENYWNTVAYDKRQAGMDDSFACASASAYAHMGQALRAMKRNRNDQGTQGKDSGERRGYK